MPLKNPKSGHALVTGGTGFVGSHLVDSLISDHWTVDVVVRSSSSNSSLPADGWNSVTWDEIFENPDCDLDQVDVIYYLAGLTKTIRKQEFLEVNVDLLQRFMNAVARKGFKGHFILVSSLAGAGPCPESHLRNESDTLKPVSSYGKSKRLGERVAAKFRDQFPVTILRPGAIYGPREKDILEVIKALQYRLALSMGPDIRVQLTHVDDIVSGLRAVTGCRTTFGKAYFLNTQEIVGYRESMDVISKALGGGRPKQIVLPLILGALVVNALHAASVLAGKPVSPLTRDKFREIRAGSWIADSSRLQEDTDWKPEHSLIDGMKQTIEWYRSEGWLKK